jgi:hypothetical protein
MPTAFSIDFPRIVAVELAGSARKPRVKRVVVGDLADARNEDGTPVADKQGHLNAQVAKFVKDNKLAGGKHYLLVGPDAMRYRELRLAFSDKRQISRVLPYQVEGLIPNIPIDEMSLGHVILIQEPASTLLLVHAAEKEYIRQRIAALEVAGCSIESADSHLSGTINLGLLHPELGPAQPPALWIDFAGTTAAVFVVDKGKVQTARVFVSPYLAGASGQTATATASRDEAEQHRLEAEARARQVAAAMGELPTADSSTLPKAESVNMGAEQVADRIRHMSRDELDKFIHRVTIESRRTMAISRFDAEPARLVVSGLGHEGALITQRLGDSLGMEQSAAINLMDSVKRDAKRGEDSARLPDLGELTYLTGVALKGLGRDETHIDFRYGDLAAGTLMDYARTPLAFTATLALLFAGILFLVSFTHVRRYEADIAALRDHERGPRYYFEKVAFRDVDPGKLDSKEEQAQAKYADFPDNPAAEIESAYNKLLAHQKRKQGAVTDNFERPTPADQVLLAAMRAISDAKPSYDFAVTQIVIANNNLIMNCFTSLSETAEERQKAGVRDVEFDRLLASLRRMVATNPKLFIREGEGGGVDSNGGRPQEGPEGRKVDQIKFTIPLVKPVPPKKPTPSGAAAKGAPKQ